MAVMEPLNNGAVEQKALPVPSAEKLALGSNINGTITHEIPLTESAPIEPAKSPTHLISTNSPSPSLHNGEQPPSTNGIDDSEPIVNGDSTADVNAPSAAPSTTSVAQTVDAVATAPATAVESDNAPVSQDTPADATQQEAAAPISIETSLSGSQTLPTEQSETDGGVDANGMGTSTSTLEDVALPTTELPHHPSAQANADPSEAPLEPAPTPVEPAFTSAQDQDMPDAVSSPNKISHERDDDEVEGPAAKRTKTKADADAIPEFKVPDVPQPAEQASAGALDVPEKEEHVASSITGPQKKFLMAMLRNLKRTKDALPFSTPVDPVKLNIPSYFDIIKHPMDIGTMEEKLKADRYKIVDEVIADFHQIVQNTTTFNAKEHPVTKSEQTLKMSFDRQIEKLPKPDVVEPTPAEKKAKKAAVVPKTVPRRESRSATGVAQGAGAAPSPTVAATSPAGGQTFALVGGVPIIRRDSTAGDGRPKREIHAPAPRDLPYAVSKPRKKKFQLELKFCEKVLAELNKPKYAQFAFPFYNPVDPVALNIPHYHKVIKKPMDLATIGAKLKAGQYENAKEFEADIRLMFTNCYKFNPVGEPVHNMGKDLEEVFNEEWSKKQQFIEDHTPRSNPASPRSSVEPEEEEEEEEEDDEEDEENQLSILQKQIAAMSKQVEMIQKKKSSPPAVGKKSKSTKSTKKGEKKVSGSKPGVKVEKKSSKAKAPARIPYVTYDQKQEISTSISTLSPVRMQQALKIIRDNMPNLPDSQDDEIELDIDELSNEVLFQLLTFVRKYAPVPEGAKEEPAPKSKPRSENKSAAAKPKKNKPMSKQEQEARISELQGKLKSYQHAASSESPEPTKQEDETSASESESGSESEEE